MSSSYDQVAEDDSTNSLEEEFKLFDSTCSILKDSQANIILFLHKMDKLERKLRGVPFDTSVIQCPIPFNGDPHSLEDVKAYLRTAFWNIAHKTNRHVTVAYTSIPNAEELGKLALSFAVPR